jgi:hypothetical protein
MNRTIALGAAWTVSAAAAVGLGFLAVSLVDASADPGTRPVAATTTASTGTSSPTVPPLSSMATAEYATAGGAVVADCAGGSPVLAGVPAAGWWVDDSNDLGTMEFQNGAQNVEVRVACVGGAPKFTFDDSSPSSSSSSSSPASSPTSGTAGSDDSSGRSGDGHGADDPPGDDSSGRSGGGHGSDG